MNRKIFISYAREDEEWLTRILPFLQTLQHLHGIEIWWDGNIGAGRKWGEEIQKALDLSIAAVCLISEHFLSSNFIWQKELPEILKGVEEDGKIFIPIIVRNCPFNLFESLSRFQSVNSPDNALENLSKLEQDKIFTLTVKALSEFFLEYTDNGK
ncbi:MAG: toll/interleukin-1 receptor domain-containing protein [Xenococcus sp. (in: cyanobacteria)]